jgi:hypothetical protein
MRISMDGNAVVPAIVCLLFSQAVNAAQPWYELQIVFPPASNSQITTQLTGGWPLVIRATAPKGTPTYAFDDGTLAVVASDPSGCFDRLFATDPGDTCLLAPPKEVYTSIWRDFDAPGLQDVLGQRDLTDALVDSAGGGGPVFRGLGPGGSATFVTAGPDTGVEVRDGYGYGANDDWPQLVLLSNHGVGIVLDEYFNRGPTERRRNLAGFLSWAAYDLADEKGRSVVSSGTVVPYALFSPLVLVDEAVGQPDSGGAYRSNVQFRVDGEPIRTGNYNCLQPQYAGLLYATDYELRAFLVNGPAPSVLSDMDGDGDVDAADVELSGLEVISSERTVRFRLWDGEFGADNNAYFSERSNRIHADLDGNGQGINPPCDSGDIGPGKVRPPPR